jgi:hypothetical protein
MLVLRMIADKDGSCTGRSMPPIPPTRVQQERVRLLHLLLQSTLRALLKSVFERSRRVFPPSLETDHFLLVLIDAFLML